MQPRSTPRRYRNSPLYEPHFSDLRSATFPNSKCGGCCTYRQALSQLQARFDAQSQQLAAAESLSATSKRRILELEARLADTESKGARTEIAEKSVAEWSAGAVIYLVERIFSAEHKTAQISEFVKELKIRAGAEAGTGAGSANTAEPVTGAVLLGTTQIKHFRALKLSDPETMELLQEKIEALKQYRPHSQSQQHNLQAPPGGPPPSAHESSIASEILPP